MARRLHIGFSDGQYYVTLCECGEKCCTPYAAMFNWRELLLLKLASFFGSRAQRMIRHKDDESSTRVADMLPSFDKEAEGDSK